MNFELVNLPFLDRDCLWFIYVMIECVLMSVFSTPKTHFDCFATKKVIIIIIVVYHLL